MSRISYDASRSSLSTYEVTGFSMETGEEILPLKIEKISASSGVPFSYSGYVEEYALFPDFWGRAVIKIKYSILTDSTIWGDDFIFSFPVGDQLPIDSLRVMVISLKPFAWKCGERTGDVAPLPGIPETLSVSFFSLDAVEDDYFTADGLFFTASSFYDFSQIARKCLVLFGGKLSADAVVRQKALELSTGFSREERARRIFDFVSSSVSYTAIEWGWRGFYPQEPSATLSAGRGDCKDKVSLLIAMLESAGIRAWPALLATRDFPDISLSPPAVFFNHVIALVEIKSESVFCDPSDFGTPFGVLPLRDRSVNALVLFQDTFLLMRTPSDFKDTYRRIITGFISSEGAAEFTVLDTIIGVISSIYRKEILSYGSSPAYVWFSSRLPGWKILGAWAYSNYQGSATLGARIFRKIPPSEVNYFHMPLLYISPPMLSGFFTQGPLDFSSQMKIAVPENLYSVLPSDYIFEDRLLKIIYTYERTADSIFVFHGFQIKKDSLASDELLEYKKNLATAELFSKRPLLFIFERR